MNFWISLVPSPPELVHYFATSFNQFSPIEPCFSPWSTCWLYCACCFDPYRHRCSGIMGWCRVWTTGCERSWECGRWDAATHCERIPRISLFTCGSRWLPYPGTDRYCSTRTPFSFFFSLLMIFQNSKLVPVLANRQDAYFGPFLCFFSAWKTNWPSFVSPLNSCCLILHILMESVDSHRQRGCILIRAGQFWCLRAWGHRELCDTHSCWGSVGSGCSTGSLFQWGDDMNQVHYMWKGCCSNLVSV